MIRRLVIALSWTLFVGYMAFLCIAFFGPGRGLQ